jgi:hypothetical protein
MKKDNTNEVFSQGYKFWDGKLKSILDKNGKLTIVGDIDNPKSGSLTEFPSWKDYVRKEMGDEPVRSGAEDDVVEQLSMMLGDYSPITDEIPDTTKRSKTRTTTDTKGEEMAKPTATTKAVAKKVAPAPVKKTAAPVKVKAEVVQNPCICGCGAMVNKNFAPGHDARFHGWMKKISDGRMTFKDPILNPDAVKNLKKHGVVQGVPVAK